jgi:uncharacterized protein YeeX (DUF496 family)
MMATVPINYARLLKAKRKLDKAWKDSEGKGDTEKGLADVLLLENDMKKVRLNMNMNNLINVSMNRS